MKEDIEDGIHLTMMTWIKITDLVNRILLIEEWLKGMGAYDLVSYITPI
jgi:hypothetical protein